MQEVKIEDMSLGMLFLENERIKRAIGNIKNTMEALIRDADQVGKRMISLIPQGPVVEGAWIYWTDHIASVRRKSVEDAALKKPLA